ncbi:hypothetical protein BKA69DRAFT_1128613 [Paraphysoderma sedebokerense]|nr:hypothetical protein BKA69DRAFT_1128613 [Paraphysoderma sedebokerense]
MKTKKGRKAVSARTLPQLLPTNADGTERRITTQNQSMVDARNRQNCNSTEFHPHQPSTIKQHPNHSPNSQATVLDVSKDSMQQSSSTQQATLEPAEHIPQHQSKQIPTKNEASNHCKPVELINNRNRDDNEPQAAEAVKGQAKAHGKKDAKKAKKNKVDKPPIKVENLRNQNINKQQKEDTEIMRSRKIAAVWKKIQRKKSITSILPCCRMHFANTLLGRHAISRYTHSNAFTNMKTIDPLSKDWVDVICNGFFTLGNGIVVLGGGKYCCANSAIGVGVRVKGHVVIGRIYEEDGRDQDTGHLIVHVECNSPPPSDAKFQSTIQPPINQVNLDKIHTNRNPKMPAKMYGNVPTKNAMNNQDPPMPNRKQPEINPLVSKNKSSILPIPIVRFTRKVRIGHDLVGLPGGWVDDFMSVHGPFAYYGKEYDSEHVIHADGVLAKIHFYDRDPKRNTHSFNYTEVCTDGSIDSSPEAFAVAGPAKFPQQLYVDIWGQYPLITPTYTLTCYGYRADTLPPNLQVFWKGSVGAKYKGSEQSNYSQTLWNLLMSLHRNESSSTECYGLLTDLLAVDKSKPDTLVDRLNKQVKNSSFSSLYQPTLILKPSQSLSLNAGEIFVQNKNFITKCSYCASIRIGIKKLWICKECNVMAYCSSNCYDQQKDWHDIWCGLLKKVARFELVSRDDVEKAFERTSGKASTPKSTNTPIKHCNGTGMETTPLEDNLKLKAAIPAVCGHIPPPSNNSRDENRNQTFISKCPDLPNSVFRQSDLFKLRRSTIQNLIYMKASSGVQQIKNNSCEFRGQSSVPSTARPVMPTQFNKTEHAASDLIIKGAATTEKPNRTNKELNAPEYTALLLNYIPAAPVSPQKATHTDPSNAGFNEIENKPHIPAPALVQRLIQPDTASPKEKTQNAEFSTNNKPGAHNQNSATDKGNGNGANQIPPNPGGKKKKKKRKAKRKG